MFAALLRFMLGGKQPPAPPPCRLTEHEALDIARRAVVEALPHYAGILADKMPLHVSGIEQTQQGVEWLIGTPTIGSGISLRIDDATATVIECVKWGVR